MPQYDEYDEDQYEAEQQEGQERERRENADIRALRKKAKAHDEAVASAAAAQRQLLFFQAGLDPSDQKAQWFVKGYDGEATAEKIREAATYAGLLTPPAPPAPDEDAQQVAAEGQALKAQDRLRDGGDTPRETGDLNAEIAEVARATGGDPQKIAEVLERHGQRTSISAG